MMSKCAKDLRSNENNLDCITEMKKTTCYETMNV